MGKGKESELRKTGFLVRPNHTTRSCRILNVFIWSKIIPLFSVQEGEILKQRAYHFGVGSYWVKGSRRREMTLPSLEGLRKKSSLAEDAGPKRLLVGKLCV